VAYLFNIVNEPQITDLYFHNVLHCAACQSLRFFVCTSLSNCELYELLILFHLKFMNFKPEIKFIKFELHNYAANNDARILQLNQISDTCTGGMWSSEPVVMMWYDNEMKWNDDVSYRRNVLQRSSGIDNPGSVVGHLAITLLIAWIACYFCIWKGIRWTGKVSASFLKMIYVTRPKTFKKKMFKTFVEGTRAAWRWEVFTCEIEPFQKCFRRGCIKS